MIQNIKNTFSVVWVSVFFSSAFGGSSNESVPFQITESNHKEIVIQFNSPDLIRTQGSHSDYKKGVNISVEYPYIKSPSYGDPDLPILQSFIRVPDKGKISLSVEHIVTEQIGEFDILPFQPKKKIECSKSLVFQINTEIFKKNMDFPKLFVSLISCEIWRDFRIARINLCPVLYNPVTRQVTHIRKAIITLSVDQKRQGIAELNLSDRTIIPSFSLLYRDVLNVNKNDIRTSMTNKVGSYIFLGNSQNLEAVKDLIEWKKRKGYVVHQAVVGSDSIKQSFESIDGWIENAYKTWPCKPEYILLVGNKEVIPPKMDKDPLHNSLHPADTYFGAIGQTNIPSIHVGRITGNKSTNTDDPAVLKYIAWKIITHETKPSDEKWRAINLAWGSEAGGMGKKIQNKWTAITEKGLTVVRGTDEITGSNETLMDCAAYTKKFNEGSSLATYIGHGLTDQWHSLKFTNETVKNEVKNGTKFPFIFSCSCLGGDYVKTYCLYENLLCEGSISDPKGAVNAFGFSCRATVTDSGVVYHALKHMFEDARWRIGPATSPAKKFAPFSTDALCSMIFGCPESEFYTVHPLKQLRVVYTIKGTEFSAQVTEGGNSVSGALVGLVTKKYEYLTSGFTGSDGVFKDKIPLNLLHKDSLFLTVTNHNGKPIIKTISAQETGLQKLQQKKLPFFTCKGIHRGFKNKNLFLSMVIPHTGTVIVKVINVKGETILKKNQFFLNQGIRDIELNLVSNTQRSIAKGFYMILMQFGKQNLMRSITIF